MTPLRDHVRDLARAVGPLGALVARVLAVGPQGVARLAVLVREGDALPDVATIGPWTEPVSVGGVSVRAVAVRAEIGRSLAATHDRHAAVRLASEPPRDGCVWALLYEPHGCAVLLARPSSVGGTGAPSSPRSAPTMRGAA